METTDHKTFKPFDKVLTKCGKVWIADYYSNHITGQKNMHRTFRGFFYDDSILAYEGNENLVGTTNEPSEEIVLKEGEYLFVINDIVETPTWWNLIQLDYVNSYVFFDVEGGKWHYAVKFSDFNPNNMEETKKHILCIRDGKVVKYKG